MSRSVSILGVTGSVGCSTVDMIRREPERYRVEALTANTSVAELAQTARELNAKFAAIADPSRGDALKDALAGSGIDSGAGPQAVIEAAERDADWVMAAIVGAAGLKPTLAAVRRGAMVAFANKECLVCAGDLFMAEVDKAGATLLPVDSEHNAIFQVFETEHTKMVSRIILTASGGPFRSWTKEAMAQASPAQAVAHPNWSMGAKISVDSATLMNKGLELIEAFHLFPVALDQIEVIVHPQSVIHSMVAYQDGSVLAQLGTPDMRTPIGYALGFPERIATPAEPLDFSNMGDLTFESPDLSRFPALSLCRHALQCGGANPTVLNAANEIAVARFLAGQIGFLDIATIVEETLEASEKEGSFGSLDSLEAVFEADGAARKRAAAFADARTR